MSISRGQSFLNGGMSSKSKVIEEGDLCLICCGCFVLDDGVVDGIFLAVLTTGEHMNDQGIEPEGSGGSFNGMGNEDGVAYLARSGDDAGRGVK